MVHRTMIVKMLARRAKPTTADGSKGASAMTSAFSSLFLLRSLIAVRRVSRAWIQALVPRKKDPRDLQVTSTAIHPAL